MSILVDSRPPLWLLALDTESRLNVGSSKEVWLAVDDGVLSSHKFSLDAAGGVVGSMMELIELTDKVGRCDIWR